MDIASYRRQHGMPQRACAKWLGVSVRQLVRWERRESIPKAAMQARVRRLTRGAVGPEDWRSAGPARPPLAL